MEIKQLYFCIKLTENEHYICAAELEQDCKRSGAKIVYWRKLNDGHVQMYREVKVQGNKYQVNTVKKWIKGQKWDKYHIEKNPYKLTDEEYMNKFILPK